GRGGGGGRNKGEARGGVSGPLWARGGCVWRCETRLAGSETRRGVLCSSPAGASLRTNALRVGARPGHPRLADVRHYFFFVAEAPPAGASLVAALIGFAPPVPLRTPGAASGPLPGLAASPAPEPVCFHSATDQTGCVSMTNRARSSMSFLNDSVVMFSLSMTRSRMNRLVLGM